MYPDIIESLTQKRSELVHVDQGHDEGEQLDKGTPQQLSTTDR